MGCVQPLSTAQLLNFGVRLDNAVLTSYSTFTGAQDLPYHGNCRKLCFTNYTIIKRNVLRLMLNCKLSWASKLYSTWGMSNITIPVQNFKYLTAPIHTLFQEVHSGSAHDLGTTNVNTFPTQRLEQSPMVPSRSKIFNSVILGTRQNSQFPSYFTLLPNQ